MFIIDIRNMHILMGVNLFQKPECATRESEFSAARPGKSWAEMPRTRRIDQNAAAL